MILHPPRHILGPALMLLSLFSIFGCAGPKQTELKVSNRTTALVLEEPVIWRQSDNRTGEMESKLAAGKYTVVGEDDLGTYYKGGAQCYSETFIVPNWNSGRFKPGDSFAVDCGVYVPFSSSNEVRLFSVEGTLASFKKDNVAAAASSGLSQSGTTNDTVNRVSVNSSASPLQSGVGAGLGVAIATGLLELQKGSFQKNNIIKPPSALVEKVKEQLKY